MQKMCEVLEVDNIKNQDVKVTKIYIEYLEKELDQKQEEVRDLQSQLNLLKEENRRTKFLFSSESEDRKKAEEDLDWWRKRALTLENERLISYEKMFRARDQVAEMAENLDDFIEKVNRTVAEMVEKRSVEYSGGEAVMEEDSVVSSYEAEKYKKVSNIHDDVDSSVGESSIMEISVCSLDDRETDEKDSSDESDHESEDEVKKKTVVGTKKGSSKYSPFYKRTLDGRGECRLCGSSYAWKSGLTSMRYHLSGAHPIEFQKLLGHTSASPSAPVAQSAPTVPTPPDAPKRYRPPPPPSDYNDSHTHTNEISHVITPKTNLIVSASVDGQMKVFKFKNSEELELVKEFRCHTGNMSTLCANPDGTMLASVCRSEKTVKVIDLETFDMINTIQLDFPPKAANWVYKTEDPIAYLAIGAADSGKVIVVDGKAPGWPVCVKDKLHSAPVISIEYSQSLDMIVSIDDSGTIECWSSDRGTRQGFNEYTWKNKLETDLYTFKKAKTVPVFATFDPTGIKLATFSEDRKIRVLDMTSGKSMTTITVTAQRYKIEAMSDDNYVSQKMKWSRRIAAEKDQDKNKHQSLKNSKLCFDDTGNFILYPTPIGVEVFNLDRNKVARIIGKDYTTRFISVSLCTAPRCSTHQDGSITSETPADSDNRSNESDLMLICVGLRKDHFHYTHLKPLNVGCEKDNQSVSSENEATEPPMEDSFTEDMEEEGNKMNKEAVIHTSFGDIKIRLFADECPKTVENFCTHSRRGYYNGVKFHRVTKSVSIQTGDPTGTGTGGETIWGEDLEDEFHPHLRHDKPFQVSMYSGSQFLITLGPSACYDDRSNLFGELISGKSVVERISNAPAYKNGRPREKIIVKSISVK